MDRGWNYWFGDDEENENEMYNNFTGILQSEEETNKINWLLQGILYDMYYFYTYNIDECAEFLSFISGESTTSQDVYNYLISYYIEPKPGDKAKYDYSGIRSDRYGKPPSNALSRYYPDLNMTFRSLWEANYVRYLNYMGIKWEYEPKRFYFPEHGVSYLPDFYLPDADLWIEIKGFLGEHSKLRLDLFRKYYPEENLEIIDGKKYEIIKKKYSKLIPNWDKKGVRNVDKIRENFEELL